jgi:hypothetical protein
METKVLDFKNNKIQELTIDDLKSTVKEEDYNGKPLMGMYHWQFIELAMEQIKSAGLNYKLEPIWAAQNLDKARPEAIVIEKYREEYGEGDVRSFLLRRILTRVVITDLEDEFTSTAIALSFNQLGFQLAYGPNVKICQNLAILGSDKFMSTYASDNKMPNPGRMIEVLGEWLGKFKEIRKQEKETILKMNDIIVPDTEVMEIIGDMTTRRIKRENPKFPKEPLNPLNQSQIGQFATSYLTERASNPQKIFNVWDIYNIATELYKPGSTDLPILLSSNYAMSQYLMERYGIHSN